MSGDQFHQLDLQLQRILGHLQTELGGDGVEGNVVRQLKELRKDIKQLQAHVTGSPDHPGIATRLDRLEIAEQNRAKINSAALLAIVSLVIKACWDVLAR